MPRHGDSRSQSHRRHGRHQEPSSSSRNPPPQEYLVQRAPTYPSRRPEPARAPLVIRVGSSSTGPPAPLPPPPPPEKTLEKAGTVINGYKSISWLGKGKYGEVWKCYNEKVDCVAVKILKEEPGNEQRTQLQRSEEATLLKFKNDKSKSRNIIIFYESFSYKYLGSRYRCFVFELAEGGHLTRKIKKNKMTEMNKKGVLLACLNGLQYLHSKGCVHCDIKPENILLKDPDLFDIRITDFGVAKWLPVGYKVVPVTSLGGTPSYMAPEAYDFTLHRGLDIWSMGVTLWEMYNGIDTLPVCPPDKNLDVKRQGDVYWSRCRKLKEEKYWDTSGWKGNQGAKALCQRMLDLSYSSRITAEDAFDDTWLNSRN